MMRGLGAKFVACLSCTLFCFGVVNVSYGVKLADLPAGVGYMTDIQDKDHATLQNIYIDEAGRTVAEVSFLL